MSEEKTPQNQQNNAQSPEQLVAELQVAHEKIKALESQLQALEQTKSQLETLQAGVQARDELLWKVYEKEVQGFAEPIREKHLKRDLFSDPLTALKAVETARAFMEDLRAAAENGEGKQEGAKVENDPTRAPVNTKDKSETPSFADRRSMLQYFMELTTGDAGKR